MAIAYKSFKEIKAPVDITEITIDKPSSVVVNNLMIATIVVDGSAIIDVATGWEGLQANIANGITLFTAYKIAGESEPDDYTFEFVLGSGQAYGFIMRFTGHDTSTPINISGITSGTSAAPTCPSVTTTKDSCMILRIFGADDNDINVDGVPTGYPSGTTGITLDESGGDNSCSGGAAYQTTNQESWGVTGTAEFTLTASEQWIAITVAIQQAGAGSPSESPSPSASASPSSSVSPSPSQTPSVSVSPSLSPSSSVSPSASISLSISPSTSISPSASPSASISLSLSPSSSVSSSPSSSISPSPTPGDVDIYGLPAYNTGGTAQLVTNEFTNLGHLIDEEVTVIGTDVDGVTTVFDDETVDSEGDINITSEDPHAHNFVKKARVGLRYTYILKPMRMDLMTQEGTSKGSIKKFAEVVVSFHKTLGAKQGKDTSNLHTITDFGSTLFTGDVVVSTIGGYGVEDDFVISGDDPLPCVVRAIVPRVKKIGR